MTEQDAADRAVKKVFAILGVDIDKPESIEEFRRICGLVGRCAGLLITQ